MIKKEANNKARVRRHERVRKTVSGTAECPRLNVFRSNKGIYAQVIDDVTGTLQVLLTLNYILQMEVISKLLKQLEKILLKNVKN